jgi:1,3-beta-glucan synthase
MLNFNTANSTISVVNFGNAGYIATGRGFATRRIPFYKLYSAFDSPIKDGLYLALRLIVITMFFKGYVVYFWLVCVAFVFSPVIFNPFQFHFKEFIVNYL